MTVTDIDLDADNPIDLIEGLAEGCNWDFDRLSDDQIAFAIERVWCTYSVTIAWAQHDDTLRLVCTYEATPPQDKLSKLYHVLNNINDQCWLGAFTYWADNELIIYRYALPFTEEQELSSEQLHRVIEVAISTCERFYPAITLTLWNNCHPDQAIQSVMAHAYGRA